MEGRAGTHPPLGHLSSFSDSLVCGELRFPSDSTEESGWNSWGVGESLSGLLGNSLIVE